jgi:hypothetical protein
MRLTRLLAKPSAVVYPWIGSRSAKSGDARTKTSTLRVNLMAWNYIPQPTVYVIRVTTVLTRYLIDLRHY